MDRDMREKSDGRDYDMERSDARVVSQLNYLGDGLSKLNALVGELEERIDVVLYPDLAKTSPGDGPDAPPSIESDLSRLVNSLNAQARNIAGRISTITDRVQL